jgi:glutamate-1-semialdehyde 2,1-aminomutase
MGRRDILSVYDPAASDSDSFVNQIGTLNGNPVACAAGLATLAELRKPGAYDRLHETGSKIRTAIVDICNRNGIPVYLAGEDAIFDIYFTNQPVLNYRDTLTADTQMMGRFNGGLLELGILKGHQKFYPSTVHTNEDVDNTIKAFEEVVPTLRS